MNTEEDIKKMENNVQDNIDVLSEKIINYNKKLQEFNLDSKSRYKLKKKNNLNLNFILPCFMLLYIIIYFILRKIEPEFICNKIKDEETFLIKNYLCNIKLISFSLIITICSLTVFYLFYYIYSSRGY